MILGKAGARAELGESPHNMGKGPSCIDYGELGITDVIRTARTDIHGLDNIFLPLPCGLVLIADLSALCSTMAPDLLPPSWLSLCLVSSKWLGHCLGTDAASCPEGSGGM